MFDKLFGRHQVKKTILIAEDDALLSNVLSEHFSREGFEVVVVQNGLEVFKYAEKFKPKVVLLDLVLPGLDGFGVLKELKSDSLTKGIPVIVLSNLDNPGDLKAALGLGAENYFIKSNMGMGELSRYIKDKLKI